MNPKLWLNRENLLHNLRALKKKTKSDFVCPMVKANAYGVGDVLVVGTLLEAGVKSFGVARFFEAEKLRRHFPTQDFDVLVFHPLDKKNLRPYLDNSITAVVSSFRDFAALETLKPSELEELKPVHIKFDLGMNRLGFYLEEVEKIKDKILSLDLRIGGVCGHFSTSEDYGSLCGQSENLLKNLIQAAFVLGVEEQRVHAPNSDALLRGDFNVGIRPGLSLYGLSSLEDRALKGALKLTSPIVAVNSLQKGDKVSYGGTWEAKSEGKIGILPIGYADGLRRGLSNKIKFRLGKSFCKQVGAICMDYSMIDLGQSESVKEGDEVVLFNEENLDLLYEWAELLGSLPYEILTGLGDRVERRVC